MAVAFHGIHMEVSCQLWHDTEKAGAVYGLCMEQYQRFQIVSYFVVLKACMQTFKVVLFVFHSSILFLRILALFIIGQSKITFQRFCVWYLPFELLAYCR